MMMSITVYSGHRPWAHIYTYGPFSDQHEPTIKNWRDCLVKGGARAELRYFDPLVPTQYELPMPDPNFIENLCGMETPAL